MSMILKIEVIALAILFLIMVVRNVNLKKMKLKYSFSWLVVALLLVISAFFPGLIIDLAHLLGFETASNFIFFLSIIWLAIMCFQLTTTISKQEDKIKRLTQIISINKKKAQDEEESVEQLIDDEENE